MISQHYTAFIIRNPLRWLSPSWKIWLYSSFTAYSMKMTQNDSKVTRLDSQSDNDFDWLWMTQSEDLTLQQSYSIFHESRLRMTQYDSESDKWLKLTLNDSEWLRMTRSDSRTCCKAQDSGLITHHWYLIRQSPAFPSRFIKSSEKGHQIHTAQSRNPWDKKKGHHRITIYSS